MLTVRATNKLLQRVGPPTLQEGEQSTTLLGQWYATALFCKPQIAVLVNEPTLLPVLMPLAPAATWPARIGQQIAAVLAAHATPPSVIDEELRHMRDCRLARTTNRSVVGIMNEFTYLAEAYHDHHPGQDLLDLAMRPLGYAGRPDVGDRGHRVGQSSRLPRATHPNSRTQDQDRPHPVVAALFPLRVSP